MNERTFRLNDILESRMRGVTYREIGLKYGISKERAMQIHNKAHRNFREKINKEPKASQYLLKQYEPMLLKLHDLSLIC